MTVAQRVQFAMKGGSEARRTLIRDNNKVVQRAVLQSPRLTDRKSKPSLRWPASPMRFFASSPVTAISQELRRCPQPHQQSQGASRRHHAHATHAHAVDLKRLPPTRTFPKLSAPRPSSSSAPAQILENKTFCIRRFAAAHPRRLGAGRQLGVLQMNPVASW